MKDARHRFIEAQRRLLARYGVEAESLFVEAPSIGGRAHVLVSGEGRALVMANGIGTPGAMWAPLMAKLEGFRLFAVDLPGYGLTDTHSRLADDLRRSAVHFLDEVLERLALERPAFVANSLGSLWVSWLALDRPERVAAMVHVGCPAMVLDSSAPFPMRVLAVRPFGMLLTRLRPPSPRQVEGLSRMVKAWPLVPELAELLEATERLPGFRPTFLSTLHVLVRLRGSRPETRLTAAQLAAIRQPTLLVWGADDPFGSPDVGERMAVVMPDAQLHVVQGGHVPWLTEADRVGAAARRFLRQYR